MPDWKQISKLLAEMHNEYGKGAVTLEGENAFSKAVEENQVFYDLGSPQRHMEWEEETLTPKMIRKWLWELRKDDILERKDVFAWTVWEEDKSVGGLGALVADELNDILDDTIKIEVTDG
tara:strand:+ start:1993 stop:2352 length:360 start_codon:yes stop_codon:yes gene_type:complete